MRPLSRLLYLFLIILSLVLSASSALAGSPEDQKAVEALLACQCGSCDLMPVNECDCGWAEQAKTDIAAKLAMGMTKDQVVKEYLAMYGEKVLVAPPKKGFNLTAWVTPFAAIILGGVLLYFLLRRWAKVEGPGGRRDGRSRRVSEEEVNRYGGRLEEEMKKYL